MQVSLYHGTNITSLEKFDKTKSRKDVDFGVGIYFTSNFKQALEWSCKNNEKGAVYEIIINLEEENLNIMKCSEEESKEIFYYCFHESEEVVGEVFPEFDKADIIYGYMLSDKWKLIKPFQEFHGKDISVRGIDKSKIRVCYDKKSQYDTLESLINIMKLHGKGYAQFCFKTDKAINCANKCIKKIYYTKKTGQEINIEKMKFINYDEQKFKYEKEKNKSSYR